MVQIINSVTSPFRGESEENAKWGAFETALKKIERNFSGNFLM